MHSTMPNSKWRRTEQAIQATPLTGPLLCMLWSLGWLLPNHARPWVAFHSDVWIAAGLAGALVWMATKINRWSISGTSVALGFLCLVPWLQFAFDLISLSGVALMSSIYLLGLAIAYSLGENWTKFTQDTAVEFVLAAAAVAAFVSVGLQLYQWLGLTDSDTVTDIWVLYYDGTGGRPFGNIGQPNQLATLQLWALVALAWALHRKKIGVWGVVLGALPLLLGIALTQSRTAMLSLSVWLLLAVVLGHERLFSRNWLWGAAALYAAFWVMVALVDPIVRHLDLAPPPSVDKRLEVGLRLPGWLMFLDAVAERPWFGYGWDQSRLAMLEVFPNHLALTGLPFGQAHNLFLDLVLWVGLPIGILLSVAISVWMAQRFFRIRSTEQALVWAALLAMGVHAMLELPLHYAYFLLPSGVLAGALHQMQRAEPARFTVHKVLVLLVACSSIFLLAVIVRDYFRVEHSHLELRFESQNVGKDHNRNPPDTLLLTQWRGVIELSRLTPRAGLTDQEVDRWRDLALYHASVLNLQHMLAILSLNGRQAEAEFWSKRVCAIFNQATCDSIVNRWRDTYGTNPL